MWLLRDDGRWNTGAERLATPARVWRCGAMLDEECLNVRLSDYFRQRREAALDLQPEDAEPNGSSEPDDMVAPGAG